MKFSIGDKVTYCPSHGDNENGIVKAVSDDLPIVFVVYHCDGNWERFKSYTGCATNINDLKIGWDN